MDSDKYDLKDFIEANRDKIDAITPRNPSIPLDDEWRDPMYDKMFTDSIKSEYTHGMRIMLCQMNDLYTQLRPGSMGTVDYVDDIGTIHMKWDNGSSLGLIIGTDKFEIIERPSPKLDFSKLTFSDEVLSIQESLKDIEPFFNEDEIKAILNSTKDK